MSCPVYRAQDFGLEYGSRVSGMLVNTLFFLFSHERTAFFALTWSSLAGRGAGGWLRWW